VADSPTAAPSASAAFPCRNCGAELAWDPDRDVLGCAHCGATQAVPRASGAVLERPLEEGLAAARGLGLEARAVQCGRCGALVQLAGAATAGACVFCGSAQVLAQAAHRQPLRPESIVPLEFGRAKAEQAARRWLKQRWFRPRALEPLASFQARGVYLPYWTFDARVHSDWSADAGHYYYETQLVPVMVQGKLRMQSRQVRKIRWVPAWGQRDDVYDDLLVHASKGVAEELVAKLGGFDTKALVPYQPEYLAGWQAEEYQHDLEASWSRGRERIVESQRARCSSDVPGDTQRNLKVDNRIFDVRWKHVLLPLWCLTYRYAGKDWRVLINGQNAQVKGEAPLSVPKLLAFVAVLLLAVLAVLLLARGR
jgi:DNA-directed RNA polymerase subunit RPC12/RpoP